MSESKPINIPGKGGLSRREEIDQLLRALDAKYGQPVGSPDSAEAQSQEVKEVLDALVAAISPFGNPESGEVTEAIQAARNLLR